MLSRVKQLRIQDVLVTLLNITPEKEEQNGEILAYHCPLPNHQDHTPSFKVFTNTNSFYCFGCRRGGDVINLAAYLRGCSNKEAITFLAEVFNIPRTDEMTLQEYSNLKLIPIDFLISLGINDGLKIPYYNQNREEVNIRYRQSNRKFRWANNQIIAYGTWQEWDSSYVVLVEGESDCHTLWYNDIPAYGVPGVALTSKALEHILDNLMNKEIIYIYRENDTAGETFVENIKKFLSSHGFNGIVKILNDPQYKDSSEAWLAFQGDKNTFKQWVEQRMEEAEAIILGENGLTSIKRIFPELDIPIECQIPPRWQLNVNGLFFLKETSEGGVISRQIANYPILPIRYYNNIDTNEVEVKVVYYNGSEWIEDIVSRLYLSDTKKIINLSNKGFPVNTINAKDLVAYFNDFEQINLPYLPVLSLASRFGWKEDGSFVLGEQIYKTEGGAMLEMRAEEGDLINITKTLKSQGSYELWADMVRKSILYSTPAFCFYASVASILLPIIGCQGFIIDLFGGSSTGKSTVSRLAASVWGSPAMGQGGLLRSWNATKVYLERLASTMHNLPIFFEDAQIAGDHLLAQAVYLLSDGAGKGRGSTNLIRETLTWNLVVFSTSEVPLRECSGNEGVKARVVPLGGKPFGNFKNDLFIVELNKVLHDNYGFLGPKILAILTENTNIKSELKQIYNDYLSELFTFATNEIATKLVRYFAAVATARDFVISYFPELGTPCDFIEEIFEKVNNDSINQTLGRRFVHDILGIIEANITKFQGRYDKTPPEIWGVWEENDDKIYILSYALQKIAKMLNLNYNALLASLEEEGYATRERKRLFSSKEISRFVVIHTDKIKGGLV